MTTLKIKSCAKNYKKVVYFSLYYQIEGGQLYNVFLYNPYYLSYEQKIFFSPKKISLGNYLKRGDKIYNLIYNPSIKSSEDFLFSSS